MVLLKGTSTRGLATAQEGLRLARSFSQGQGENEGTRQYFQVIVKYSW
jgi:hypothetical protein